MAEFMHLQFDFIYFICGFAYLAFAFMVYFNKDNSKEFSRVSWFSLGMFALFNCLNLWCAMISLSFPEIWQLNILYILFLLLSYLSLLEFVRNNLNTYGNRKIGVWIYIPLLICALSGSPFGIYHLNMTLKYFLGSSSTIIALIFLFSQYKKSKQTNQVIMTILFLIAFSGVFNCFVDMKAPLTPSGTLNSDILFKLSGVPSQLLLTILVIAFTTIIWIDFNEDFKGKNFVLNDKTIIPLIICIIVLGAYATYSVGKLVEMFYKGYLTVRTNTAVSAIDTRVLYKLVGNDSDIKKPEYDYLTVALNSVVSSNVDITRAYIIAQKQRGYVFLADSEPQNSTQSYKPGQPFSQSGKDINLILGNINKVVGPYSDNTSSCITAVSELKDKKTEQILGLFCVDIPKDQMDLYVMRRKLLAIFATFLFTALIISIDTINNNNELSIMNIEKREKNFKTFFNRVDEIIFVVDLDGNIITTNDAAEVRLGYSKSYFVGKELLSLFPAGKRDEASEFFGKIKSGISVKTENYILSNDNKYIYFETRAFEGEWDEDRAIFYICQDVTELKAANDMFYKLFAYNPSLMTVIDLDTTRITDVNEVLLKTLGYNKEEIIGQSIYDLNVFKDKAQLTEIRKQIDENGEFRNIDITIFAKNGEERTGLLSVDVIEVQGLVKLLAVFYDFTERKKAEVEIVRSEERFRMVAENIDEFIWLSEGAKMLYASPAYEGIWGIPCSGLYNDPYGMFGHIHSDDKDRIAYKLCAFKNNTRTRFEEEFRIVRPDKEIRWVWVRATKIDNTQNTAQKVVGVASDITDRKVSQEKIKYLSMYDMLTGLHNRYSFESELISADNEEKLPISVLFGDVNGLKLFNDTFGQLEGDKVIITASNIIRDVCGSSAIVARAGGDEFIILLTNTDETNAVKIVRQIKERCGDEVNTGLMINLSFGLASKISANEDLNEIIRTAEDRMYSNKLLEGKSVRSSILSYIRTIFMEKTRETQEHCERLVLLSSELGVALNLKESEIENLKLLSLFHDIGKAGTPDNILLKADKLSEGERIEMMKHSEIGFRIASTLPELVSISEAILSHHENYDGSGYPHNLKSREIPLLARIISIVDSYDAMTNERIYRKPLTSDAVKHELISNAGKQFDPHIVRIFLKDVLKIDIDESEFEK